MVCAHVVVQLGTVIDVIVVLKDRSLAIAAGVRALNCKHPVCISCCRQMRALSCPMCRAAPWLHHGHESDGRKGCKRMHKFVRRAAEICRLMFFMFFLGVLLKHFCFLRRSFCHPRFSFFSVLDCSRMGKWRNLFWFQCLRMLCLGKFDFTS